MKIKTQLKILVILLLSGCASDGHPSKFWQALGAMGNGMQQGSRNAASLRHQQCDLKPDGIGNYQGTCQ